MKILAMIFTSLLVMGLLGCGSSSGDDSNSTTKVKDEANNQEQEQNLSQREPSFSAGEYGAIILSGKSYEDIQDELKDVTLIDIRTAKEREFYGYPEGFVNNAVYQNRDYSVNDNGELKYNNKPHNDNFVDEVKSIVNNDLNKKIVLLCDSSSRTGAHYDGSGEIPAKDSAAKELSNAGFTNVYHIKGGFRGDEDGNYENGWEDLFSEHIVKN
jgi:rhodanese-related sulfurtransferase